MTMADLLGLPLAAAVCSVPIVVFLGVPVFLLLRRLGRLSWFSLGCAGFVLPAIPMAILGWPYNDESSFSSGGSLFGHYVQYVVNGVPTFYGWLDYAHSVLFWGLQGLAGALIFYWVWLKIARQTEAFIDYHPEKHR